jgi:hypothetical protein
MLAWSSGTLSPEDFRELLQDIFGHEFQAPIPEDVLVPNNAKSLSLKDIDTDVSGPTDANQPPSPGQGQGTGAGDSELT